MASLWTAHLYTDSPTKMIGCVLFGLLFVAVSGVDKHHEGRIVISAAPATIATGLTTTLTVRCSLKNDAKPGQAISRVTKIVLSKVRGSAQEDVASIANGKPAVAGTSALGATVTGGLPDNNGFVQATWSFPGPQLTGTYHCEITALLTDGTNIKFKTNIEVRESVDGMVKLLSKYKEQIEVLIKALTAVQPSQSARSTVVIKVLDSAKDTITSLTNAIRDVQTSHSLGADALIKLIEQSKAQVAALNAALNDLKTGVPINFKSAALVLALPNGETDSLNRALNDLNTNFSSKVKVWIKLFDELAVAIKSLKNVISDLKANKTPNTGVVLQLIEKAKFYLISLTNAIRDLKSIRSPSAEIVIKLCLRYTSEINTLRNQLIILETIGPANVAAVIKLYALSKHETELLDIDLRYLRTRHSPIAAILIRLILQSKNEIISVKKDVDRMKTPGSLNSGAVRKLLSRLDYLITYYTQAVSDVKIKHSHCAEFLIKLLERSINEFTILKKTVKDFPLS